MESLEDTLNKDPLKFTLTSLSDQEIIDTYNIIQSTISNDPNYKVVCLVNTVDTQTVKALEDILDITVGSKVYPEMDNRDIALVSDTFEQNVIDWNMYQKEVLNFTLLVKIVKNLEYINPNITVEHLKDVYHGKYISDLAFIWLASIREKLNNQQQENNIL